MGIWWAVMNLEGWNWVKMDIFVFQWLLMGQLSTLATRGLYICLGPKQSLLKQSHWSENSHIGFFFLEAAWSPQIPSFIVILLPPAVCDSCYKVQEGFFLLKTGWLKTVKINTKRVTFKTVTLSWKQSHWFYLHWEPSSVSKVKLVKVGQLVFYHESVTWGYWTLQRR